MVLGGFWVGRDLGGMGRANRTQCDVISSSVITDVDLIDILRPEDPSSSTSLEAPSLSSGGGGGGGGGEEEDVESELRRPLPLPAHRTPPPVVVLIVATVPRRNAGDAACREPTHKPGIEDEYLTI